MKTFTACVLTFVLAAFAFCQPVADVKAGMDLAIRSVGGSVSVAGLGTTATTDLPPSILVHISKAAGTLVATVPTGTLFANSGISTTLTFTGAADSTSGGIDWTVTDPAAIGKTITVEYQGVANDITVTGVSGNVFTVAAFVETPIFDPFDSVYRAVSMSMDPSQTSSIVITGTAAGLVPVTVTLTPDFSGIGGEKVTQFVNHVLLSTPTVVSGQTYTGTVFLESAVTSATSVVVTSNLAAAQTVTVPAGQSSAPFNLTVAPLYATTPAYVRAYAFGTVADEPLTALPLLASIVVNNAIAVAGAPVELTINLNAPAPSGGTVVGLHSDDLNFILPSTVTVPSGQKSVTVTATPAVVSTNSSVSGTTETYVSAQYESTVVRAALMLH